MVGGVVMNRQKTFRKLILFCVFAKSTSFVKKKKAVKEVRNPRPGEGGGGASFHEYCGKKRRLWWREKREPESASNEQQLGRPCDLEHGMLGDHEVRGRKVV